MDQWHRMERTDIPPLTGISPRDTSVVVVERDGKIVATLSVVRMTHLEGLWVDPAYKNAGVCRSLLRLSAGIAGVWDNEWVLAGAADERMRDILTRLGGVKVDMETYMLSLGGDPCRRPL